MKKMTLSGSVKNQIAEAIASGAFDSTGKLPAEDELCKQFNVSRTTVRSALQALEHDGLITIRHGAGSFIKKNGSDMRLRLDVFKSFYTLIEQSGHTPTLKQCEVDETVLPDDVLEKMKLEPGTKGLIINRVFCGDGEAVIAATEYLPSAYFADSSAVKMVVDNPNIIPASIVKFVDVFSNDRIDSTITELSAVVKGKTDNRIADELQIAEAILRLEMLLYSAEGKIVVYSDVYVDDKMIHFQVFNKRSE